MGIQKNPYPLRIDDVIIEKAKLIAKENRRSLNKEIEFVLKTVIDDYEAKNGIIELSVSEQNL